MSTANAYKLLNISRETGQQEYLRMYRMMSLVGAVCFPFFYCVYQYGTSAGYPTGIAVPLVMSVFCVLFWIGTYRFSVVKNNVQDSATVLFYLFTCHSLYNLAASGFHITFLLALMMILIIFSIAINHKMHLTWYVLFAFMSFALVNFSMNAFGDALMYQTNVATQLLILHIVITHKIELKKTLANKAELMSKLFSNSPDAIVFIDLLSNEIVNCNEAALQLFGFINKEDLRRSPLRRFFPGGNISKKLLAGMPVVSRGESFSTEDQLITRQGRAFWANVAMSNFAIGRRQFVVVRVTDVDTMQKTTEALRRSEALNRDLIDSSTSLIGLHNLDGTIVTLNPAFETVLGYKADEMIGMPLQTYMPRRNETAYRGYVESLVTDGSCEGIMTIVDARGQVKYLEYHNTLKTGDNGELVVRAMATDVTETYLLQQEITRSEKSYRLISENAHDLICQHAPDGRYDYVSVSVKRILGYDPHDLLGGDPIELVHPEDRRLFKLLSPFYTEQVDNEPSIVEYRMMHKSGAAVWVNTVFRPVLSHNGLVETYHSSSRDVSERKRVELQQERKDRLFKSLAEASAALLAETNFEDGVQRAFRTLGNALQADRIICYERSDNGDTATSNHLFEWQRAGDAFIQNDVTQRGLPVAEALPNWFPALENELVVKGATEDFPLPERLIPESRGAKSVMLLPLRSNNKLLCLLVVEHIQHTHVWSAVEESVMKTAADGLARTMERIRNERELKEAKEAAEAASQAKETFLANVSHEVRTPMNGILGLAQLLQKSNLDNTQQKYIHAIRQSGEFMLTIINDLLDFSKIVAGHMELENIPFEPAALLFNIRQTYGTRAVEKGIHLTIEADEHLPAMLKGDPVRLNQVLINLIGNAIKFTEQGRVVLRIEVLGQESGKVRLRFCVSDTGIGIPPEKQHTIFECFKQAGNDTARKYGGTGLGLSIVKKLVEAFGSTVHLKSEPGKGSAFTFELAFETVTEHRAAPVENEETYERLDGIRVLLAEDNMVNQLLAHDLITGWGAQLEMVENGEQAIDKLKAGNFDLVLMDVQMPVLGGLEATEIIRLMPDERLRHIPIVAMTADAVKQNIEKCFAAGMTDHITKPFDAGQLNALIGRTANASKKSPHQSATLQNISTAVETRTTDFRFISLASLLEFSRGKNDFVVKMLRLLIEQTPPAVDGIGKALQVCDYETVRALAHKMKPNVNLMGNAELDRLIQKLEKDAENNSSVEGMPGLYADFRELYNNAMVELQTAYDRYKQS